MILKTLAFVTGILVLHTCARLPPAYSVFIGLACAAIAMRWRCLRLPALLVLGFSWAGIQASLVYDRLLDVQLEGQTLLVEGRVADIPQQLSATDWRFVFVSERLDDGSGWRPFKRKLRLGWYRASQQPVAGQRWRLALRLKRPHGYGNPGGFDYERWLFQQRIAATGYVRKDVRNRQLEPAWQSPVSRMRQSIARQLKSMTAGSSSLSLVRALTIGDRNGITQQQWETLRATGTSHLMAISGLHISLVAGLVFWVSQLGWARVAALTAHVPARKAAALLALLAALLYAALAGFSIPTQRAAIMVGVAMLALLAARHSRPANILCLAAIAVLVNDPLAVLAAGWWLSFWAVCLIIYISSARIGRQPLWRKWTYVHLVLGISLLPVLLVFFQQTSVVAPVANSIAVPWTGLLVVPLSLLGALLLLVSDSAGGLLITIALLLLDGLWPLLHWLAEFDWALWQQSRPPLWTAVPAVAGILLLFAPRGVPGRWVGLCLLLPMLTVKPSMPPVGEARVTLLDVGQGLATVVQTRNHALLYDAGPRYSPTFDTGSRVVVPWLRSQGIDRLDRMIVSHGDNDHIGGFRSVFESIPVRRLSAGVPAALAGYAAEQCQQGDSWAWDGVTFSVLHPAIHSNEAGNNASCVVRVVSAGGRSLLLTGDIEAAAEERLVRETAIDLRADVLVVPHHGSLTSSTPEFVRAVVPDAVLFPVGYRNRYRFPRESVVDRYRAINARLYDTARHGAISVSLPADAGTPRISTWRCAFSRYWRDCD
ncbi:MAG: DNA internalization-related competence protein ComEC/Rec2 [Pseudomonadota bacterium]